MNKLQTMKKNCAEINKKNKMKLVSSYFYQNSRNFKFTKNSDFCKCKGKLQQYLFKKYFILLLVIL